MRAGTVRMSVRARLKFLVKQEKDLNERLEGNVQSGFSCACLTLLQILTTYDVFHMCRPTLRHHTTTTGQDN